MDNTSPQVPAQEPNYKAAFEIAARQRDSANQQLCNLQIDFTMMIEEKERLEKEVAELKQKIEEAHAGEVSTPTPEA